MKTASSYIQCSDDIEVYYYCVSGNLHSTNLAP